MILKKMFLLTALAVLLFAGCSDEKETTNELNKQGEEKEIILKVRSDVMEQIPREPQTNGCLRGCRDLPCDEKVRCVMRNCPNIKAECNGSEHKFFKAKEKADLLMKCIQSQNIDALKDSVRYRAVLDSCENAYAVLKKGVPLVKHKYGVMKGSVLE